ncbi:glycosyltransferase [Neoaquamicrobium sediminum]|uniref:glycosyltransferase n=1 Tax=Neoaquamicrobium sediminum TaxID=1849104 RepID=UPI001562EB77|nr:hypothetical protein [Mesorhizobium sediminum]NRC54442.1 hypothetical protein [Mesorhizobium sediminum]
MAWFCAAQWPVFAPPLTGLAASSGTYITVNDADDWSHPQRIEVQMREIGDDRPFNTTFGVRVTDSLVGAIKYRSGSCIVENTSSLLVATRIVKELGGWDEVRFSADTELYFRIMKLKGQSERILWPYTPLAFILSLPESLTNRGATSLKSLHYGARREYREAAAHWRDTEQSLIANNGPRPYPLPRDRVGAGRRACAGRQSAGRGYDKTLSTCLFKMAKRKNHVRRTSYPRDRELRGRL